MNRTTRPNDAELLHQAINVLHETGMTPRELADKLDALGTAVRRLFKVMEWAGQDDAYNEEGETDAVWAALSKYQPVTPEA